MRLGAILAGGRSSRFGSDKALATLKGMPLIAHAVTAIGPFVDALAVCGPRAVASPYPAVADWPRNDLGPLGGLCGALRFARDHGFAAVLTLPCDTPQVPADLFGRLIAIDSAAYVAELPVLGSWPTALADALAQHLEASENRSMRQWAIRIGATAIAAGFPIVNINRPADLAQLGS